MDLARREIPLAREERLVLDCVSGVWRVAFYRPKRVQGSRKILRPPEGKPLAEERYASANRSLLGALETVFGEAPDCQHSALTVFHYLRSTSWGAVIAA